MPQVWEQDLLGARHHLEQEVVEEEPDRGKVLPQELSELEQEVPAAEECGDFTLMILLESR